MKKLLCLLLLLSTLLVACGTPDDAPDAPDDSADSAFPDDSETADGGESDECVEHTYAFTAMRREADLLHEGVARYTCTVCGKTDVRKTGTLDATELGVPCLFLTGSIDKISKESADVLSCSYVNGEYSFTGYAKMKWQGGSSLAYPKKNYTIRFYDDETLTQKHKFDPYGWGNENKYCLKANYIDATQARNIVAARLFRQIVESRADGGGALQNAPCLGVIDGYPILVYLNGEFYGYYTFNIPKDNWMFGMKKSAETKQALIQGDGWTSSVYFQSEMDESLSGWSIEYATGDDTAWVRESFNDLIRFVSETDGDAFRAGIGEYLDVSSAIDCMLFTYFVCGPDNSGKNAIFATYDGKQWIQTMYDMDCSFGLVWDGLQFYETDKLVPFYAEDGTLDLRSPNLLWRRLFDNFGEEVLARYRELRADLLSVDHVKASFDAFFDAVPDAMTAAETETWEIPLRTGDTPSRLYRYLEERTPLLDAFFDAFEAALHGN